MQTAKCSGSTHTPAAADAKHPPTSPAPWPFAPLSEPQQRQRNATEAALRSGRLRAFRAFDDTVAGALA